MSDVFIFTEFEDTIGINSTSFHIAFVTQYAHYDTSFAVFLDLDKNERYLIDPKLLYVSETLVTCEVIYEEDSMGSFVVGTGDGSKPFLTCSVPNLQFYYAIIDI